MLMIYIICGNAWFVLVIMEYVQRLSPCMLFLPPEVMIHVICKMMEWCFFPIIFKIVATQRLSRVYPNTFNFEIVIWMGFISDGIDVATEDFDTKLI